MIGPNGRAHTSVHHHPAADEDIANYRRILPQYMHDIQVANQTLLSFHPPLDHLYHESEDILHAVLNHLAQKGISIEIPNNQNIFSRVPISAEDKKDFISNISLSWHSIMSILSSQSIYRHLGLRTKIYGLLNHLQILENEFAWAVRTTPSRAPVIIRRDEDFDFFEDVKHHGQR